MSHFQDYVSAVARRLFRFWQINRRKVVFCSYYGKGYSDSPKAIAEALLASGEKMDLVWLLREPAQADSLPHGIRGASYTSGLRRAWELCTAGFWIDNCRKGERCKRRGQYYLQTWHGFALKRIEADAAEALEPGYICSCKQDSRQCDLIVSNSAFMSTLYRNSFWYSGEIAEFGTPRNDIFFAPQPHLSQKVRAYFGLPQSRQLVLYAPTFRADGSIDAYRLDTQRLLDACSRRFGGEWSLLSRLHPNVATQSKGLFPYDGDRILDATGYPDMQELLCACDLLLTDYSSCMFDFALSGKPCLRFALDIEAYRQDRGFYFPLDQIPFPLADSNEGLQAAIEAFDPDAYHARWNAFTDANGFCEDGQAARRCAQWILDRLN